MTISSITAPEFALYGRAHTEFDTTALRSVLMQYNIPLNGTSYIPSIPDLEKCEPIFSHLQNHIFGGLPIQLGMCCGHNNKLNCLEYHKSSEVLIGAYDYVLLLATINDIENGILDTSKVRAFYAPSGIPVEIFSTTLHYSPCHVDPLAGFCVAVALPEKTNTEKPTFQNQSLEDTWIAGCNKWLLAHKDSAEAAGGAYIGLVGENITL